MEKAEHGTIFSRNRGKFMLAATALGLAVLAPKGWEALQNWVHPESLIVAGVPAQVERHLTASHCTWRTNGICMKYRTDYYLGLEQCTADVEAAQQGEVTTSFNPDLGWINPGCYYDQISVRYETWQGSPDGDTIIFSGPPSYHLRKN